MSQGSKAERVNVVIGAGSGMGAAVAELLAPRGPLLLVDRDESGLANVASGLPGDVATRACDVTEAGDVEALAASVARLGALVVTAGLSPSMAGGRAIYDVNLIGLERVVTELAGAIGEGSVAVCFASMAGHMMPANPALDAVIDAPLAPDFYDALARNDVDPDNSALAYALSKRGVMRLVRRHARAWGAKGARLVSLSPGIIDTGMGRLEADNQPLMAQMVEKSALARIGRPEEIAAVAAFLASDAASFLTGTDVLVDGGATVDLPR